jgi:hypothetical protein
MDKVTQQEYYSRSVRSSAVLTNGYVAGTVLGVATSSAAQVRTNDQIDEINFLALSSTIRLAQRPM